MEGKVSWKMKEEQGYFPLFIDLTEKKILVFGGGRIAYRRIRTLLEFGALIQVVAPDVREEVIALAQNHAITWTKRGYEAGEIGGVDFVLSATDSREVDAAIYQECKAKQIPVNTASDKSLCDFYFPAIVKKGHIVAGITASGENHSELKQTAERIRTLL